MTTSTASVLNKLYICQRLCSFVKKRSQCKTSLTLIQVPLFIYSLILLTVQNTNKKLHLDWFNSCYQNLSSRNFFSTKCWIVQTQTCRTTVSHDLTDKCSHWNSARRLIITVMCVGKRKKMLMNNFTHKTGALRRGGSTSPSQVILDCLAVLCLSLPRPSPLYV